MKVKEKIEIPDGTPIEKVSDGVADGAILDGTSCASSAYGFKNTTNTAWGYKNKCQGKVTTEFNKHDLDWRKQVLKNDRKKTPATEGQIKMLNKIGLEIPEGLTQGQANKLIRENRWKLDKPLYNVFGQAKNND